MIDKISSENITNEENIQISINDAIKSNQSIVFTSGAGAGKTYALIDSLKYIIKEFGNTLIKNNQTIICITYTKVATNEVKERLGNTKLVKVSTIHERIWELIKDYQLELVTIHKKRLILDIQSTENDLLNNDKFKKYNELSPIDKDNFAKIMFENKDLFNKNYNEDSASFKAVISPIIISFTNLLSNVSNFKKLVTVLFKLENYRTCIDHIHEKKKGFNFVNYNSNFNRDILHKMQISHDTLLDYSLEIINSFDILKQIIIDQYPYILVDEYQDTNEKVIRILSLLSDHADKIKHNFFVGYFGDPVQNIYDEGVGDKLTELHQGLHPISKPYNRRSTKEIIQVINNIRNDDINQVSIYENCSGGKVQFYTGCKENVNTFINRTAKDWDISHENKLHCLLLTNKSVADFSGFNNLYSLLKETKYYKQYYDQLNTELLSNDLRKLGEIPVLFFNILKFINMVIDDSTPIENLIDKTFYSILKLSDLRKLIELIKSSKGRSLGDYLSSMSELYSKSKNRVYQSILDKLTTINNFNIDRFKDFLLRVLYRNLNDDKIEEAILNIDNLLAIDIEEFNRWYNYILRIQTNKIDYHTYHGTKGLEFDNVVIIMGNAFGKDKNYFNFFFKNFDKFSSLPNEDEKVKFNKIRNLLYVSCSRAVKNLRILYIDDISEFNNSIEKLFGTSHLFTR